MPNREIKSASEVVQMLEAKNQIINNTTVVGAACDVSDCDAALIVANIGVWADTVSGGLIEIAVQESNDTVAGNFTDVADEDLTDTITLTSTVSGGADTGGFASVNATTNDVKVVATSYTGSKPYIRIKLNGEKNLASGTPLAVDLIKQRLRNSPA